MASASTTSWETSPEPTQNHPVHTPQPSDQEQQQEPSGEPQQPPPVELSSWAPTSPSAPLDWAEEVDNELPQSPEIVVAAGQQTGKRM